jgi:hypothetical protein
VISLRTPVECIAIMNQESITPLKVRYEVNDESQVIKVEKILLRDKKTVFPTMNQPRSIEHV